MLNIILGTAMKNFLSVPQIIFEYPFAFAFEEWVAYSRKNSTVFSSESFKISHSYDYFRKCCRSLRPLVLQAFLAGVLVWGMYAPEGMSPYLYSFVLNGTSTVVNCLYVSLVLGLLAKVAPQLFVLRNKLSPKSEVSWDFD